MEQVNRMAGARIFPEGTAVAALAEAGWKTDYVAVRQQSDLKSPKAGNPPLVVLAASRLGSTRLIDNIEV